MGFWLDYQKMGAFQANILESLREDFQKSLNKTSSQVEVDQTSTSASKPGPSNTRLDPPPPPPPSTNPVESMDVDYGPAFQTLGTPYPGLLLQSWALTMRKAGRSSGQEALPLCCL